MRVSRSACSSLPPTSLDVPGMKRFQLRPSLQPRGTGFLLPLPAYSAQRCGRWPLLLRAGCPFRETACRTPAPEQEKATSYPGVPQTPTRAHFQDAFLFIFILKGMFLDWDSEKLCAHFGILLLPPGQWDFSPSGYLEESATKLNRLASNPWFFKAQF